MNTITRWDPLPGGDSAAWLNRAVQVVAALSIDRVVVQSGTGWGHLDEIDSEKVTFHPTYKPHSHSVEELCLAVSGIGGIMLNDHTYRLEAPRLLLLEADVAHSEAQLDDQPYDLLWIGMASRGAAYTAFSSHRPGVGWRNRFRRSLASCGRRLQTRFIKQPQLKPACWPLLQNELLDTLVALQAAALGASPSSPLLQPDHDASVVADVQRYLSTHLTEPLRLDDVAHLVRLSPNYVNTLFRRETGRTIHAWILEQRMQKSMSLCRETDMPIKNIAVAVGFRDPLYFSKAFRRHFGMPPSKARAMLQSTQTPQGS